MSLPNSRVSPDATSLIDALVEAVSNEAEAALQTRGEFHLVLAGGRTPQALYRALAEHNIGDARWRIWYGDERCLPSDDPERNSRMAETAWLAASAIPPQNRRAIPAELGAVVAAQTYAEWLAAVGDFDLVLLGMGEDGHTASLFPGHAWNSADVLAVSAAPKPPSARVSLSAERLSRSRRVWFVVTGADKSEAIVRWNNGENLPVTNVSGKIETLLWLDQAARPVIAR
jgi:6-phosphogluconolactonase